MSPARLMPILFLVTVIVHPYSGWGEGFADILEDLKDIEVEMSANQGRIEGLQAEIGQLQALGKSAEAELLRLQALVDDQATQVQQVGERYTQLLVLAEKQKQQLETSANWNWLLGGGLAAALAVVFIEGILLVVR